MSDERFHVGAVDQHNKPSGFVAAKFLTINGQPVVDPISHGSQDFFMYSDDRGSDKTHARIANPNNYIVVPENFTEEHAKEYANGVTKLQDAPIVGGALAKARVGLDFRPGGSQDLQRGSQWGVPEDIFPARNQSLSDPTSTSRKGRSGRSDC